MDGHEDALPIQENVPLAPLTTLGVGGSARFFASVEDEARLAQAEAFAREHQLPLFVLGGGSNIVVADEGFAGLVLQIAIPGFVPDAEKPGRVAVGAGVAWDEFVRRCVSGALAGVETLSGIPGTVGGAPVQNIGAYGQEVGEVVASVRAWDIAKGMFVELQRDRCGFGYRSSVFNTTGRYIVSRVMFDLHPEGKPVLRYEELRRRFAGNPNPSLSEVRDAVLEIRKSKGMLASSDDPDAKSAGSFFKNPVVSTSDFEKLLRTAQSRGVIAPDGDIPHFDVSGASGEKCKLSAAWLIEHAGFSKGHTRGRVGISGKHALALVNRGGASAREIMDLKQDIVRRVGEDFGIWLHPEPVFVGFGDCL